MNIDFKEQIWISEHQMVSVSGNLTRHKYVQTFGLHVCLSEVGKYSAIRLAD